MLKSIIGALALAATATAASAASVQVQTKDLDLTTEAGTKKLDSRILQAARKICGADEPNTGTRVAPKSSNACVKRTVTETREKLAASGSASTS